MSHRVSPTRSDTEFSPFAGIEIRNRFKNDIQEDTRNGKFLGGISDPISRIMLTTDSGKEV